MKAKELMIGDWIADKDGDKARVVNIIADEIDGCYYGIDVFCKNADGQHFSWTVPFEEAQPIPLTAEIFEKNGFNVGQYSSWSEHHTSYTLLNDKGRLIVIVDFKEGKLNSIEVYGFLTDIESHSISSVHELQNALRLCGIEKEIEL